MESRDVLFTLAIFDALWDGYKYDKKPEVLRRTFVCPYIFGDGEEHSIISHWKYNDGYGSVELIRVTGEYILFVDADDFLPDSNVLERFVTTIQLTKADIVVGNLLNLDFLLKKLHD